MTEDKKYCFTDKHCSGGQVEEAMELVTQEECCSLEGAAAWGMVNTTERGVDCSMCADSDSLGADRNPSGEGGRADRNEQNVKNILPK